MTKAHEASGSGAVKARMVPVDALIKRAQEAGFLAIEDIEDVAASSSLEQPSPAAVTDAAIDEFLEELGFEALGASHAIWKREQVRIFLSENAATLSATEQPAAVGPEKRWPFVETPAQFADRLAEAMTWAPSLLSAVRHVLIEKPATLTPASAEAELRAEVEALEQAGHNVLCGLNARIDAAPSDAKPVFHGIVDLHDALNALRRARQIRESGE